MYSANEDIKLITLIGCPLGQSFAARMQNAAYSAMGINIKYFYTEAGTDKLPEIINKIRKDASYIGFAVTKPNKIEVMKYLDRKDELCRATGACNTVLKNKDGALLGYNTDAVGFRMAFEEAGLDVSGKKCFCFGAGGAGHAICAALTKMGADIIYITDVLEDMADSLAAKINEAFKCDKIKAVPNGCFDYIKDCDFVINASGIGMANTEGQSPMPAEYIRPGQFYFDACYNPEKTRFLIDAEAKGCRIMNGLTMSLYQGFEQIKIWTGEGAAFGAGSRFQSPQVMDRLLEVMRRELDGGRK